jgi:hypothetical protein
MVFLLGFSFTLCRRAALEKAHLIHGQVVPG